MGNNYSRIATVADQGSLHSRRQRAPFSLTSPAVRRAATFQEEVFHDMLLLERRRPERSRKPLVLMLPDAAAFLETGTADSVIAAVASVISHSRRETELGRRGHDRRLLGCSL